MRILTVALSLGIAFSTAATAASCRDGKGKFIACAPAAAQKCRDAKGKFVKCGASAATPGPAAAAH